MTKAITRAKARETDNWCRARRGLPYAFGGAFSTNPKDSTDCSGLVLQTAAYLMGRTDWPGNRYGSTESFRLDHKIVYDIGFKRLGPNLPAARAKLSTLGFAPIMLVGLQHGGGGVYSHTACTLFYADTPGGEIRPSVRGIDWESRGNVNGVGVFYYDGARAWDDPLFGDYWYLDAKLDAAPTTVPDLPRADRYALAIIAEGRRRAITPRGIVIALATALVESNLTIYANRSVPESLALPHDAIGSDAYSVGIFQQQVRQGVGGAWWWGDAQTCMDPTSSAGLFYARLATRPYTAAVTDTAAGAIAQQIQQSAYPDRYAARMPDAQRLYDRLATTPAPDDLEDAVTLESISLYATPGETRYTLSQMVQSIDGMTHRALVESAARYGDLDAIARIARVAAGAGKYRDPSAIRHATAILAEIEAQHPEYLQTYLATTKG